MATAPTEGEQRNGLGVIIERLAGCQRMCAEHRSEDGRRLTALETGSERLSQRLGALEVDVQVRSARLDAGSKIFVAAMALIGTVVSALIAHFAK